MTLEQGGDITQDPGFRRGHECVMAWARSYADSLAAVRAQVRAHPDWAGAAKDAAARGLTEDSIVDAVVAMWEWKPPAYPRELWPSWAVECEVSTAIAFDVMVTFRGTQRGSANKLAEVALECIHTIVVHDAPDVGVVVGDFVEGQPFVWCSAIGDALELHDALAMSDSLRAAAGDCVVVTR